MRAVELTGFNGLDSLKIVEVKKPKPRSQEILIEVKAAGLNFAELELTKGRYSVGSTPPFIMGFEAAGVVAEVGPGVKKFAAGDRVTAIVSSGGYAEYATADASSAIPIADGISFAQASTIPIQGLSAYTLLKYVARPKPDESVLIQAAAGGVGTYLVQLAKIMGVKKIIALASRKDKINLVKSLGAHVAIDYSQTTWTDEVRAATAANGVDVVLEAASGEVGEESFKLLAPFGRIIMFGARNIHDTLGPQKIQQLIYKNQTLIGFNFPSLRPQQVSESVPELLNFIREGKIRLLADNEFPLARVRAAFEALTRRETIGKIVLMP
jgi:NADPH2:quinone reductase